MNEEPRKISVEQLPQSADSALTEGDIQPAPDGGADVKGGGRYGARVGIRAGIRVGARSGIRKGQVGGIRSIRKLRRISSSSGDPGI